MSTKGLKLLQQEREKLASVSSEQRNSDNEHEKVETNKTVQNIFDLLRGESEDEVCEDVEIDTSKSSPQKQKKQRKKKKSNKPQTDEKLEKNEEDESLDSILDKLNGNVPGHKETNLLPFNANKNVLNVEHKSLNRDNELKKIFGAHVIQKDKRKLRSKNTKRFHLANPRQNWSGVEKSGLSMNLVENKDGILSFAFEHSRSYRDVQYMFYDAVETADPVNVINLVRKFPFHIDSLLQTCEICRLSEDWETATEMIERVLYIFERSFHAMFSLTQGACRLDYKRKENRSFYLALFHHLVFLGKRGCYRTSLEFCKLILSFSPDTDPVGILLMIDLYALKSEEYAFLVRLYQEWKDYKNLFQIPNFAFSYPLALFHFGMQNNDESSMQEANEKLQDALLMYPGLLLQMLDKCGVVPDNAVLKHDYFNNRSADPDPLKLLVELYVHRTFVCWKNPNVVEWLERNVRQLIEHFDDKRDLQAYYAQCRSTRYRGTPRNVYRHLIISEIKDLTFLLPPRFSSDPISHFDPLPPLDSITSYDNRPRPSSRSQSQPTSLPSVFFQSLFPSFNPHDVRSSSNEGAEGGGERGAELTRSVGALMEGLRGLLNTIRFIPPPTENNPQNNGEEQNWEEDDDFEN